VFEQFDFAFRMAKIVDRMVLTELLSFPLIKGTLDTYVRAVLMNEKESVIGELSIFTPGATGDKIYVIEIDTTEPARLTQREILTTFVHEIIHVIEIERMSEDKAHLFTEEAIDEYSYALVDAHTDELRILFDAYCQHFTSPQTDPSLV